ncbi:unnamed protein product [Soboliphyme baturini]|uniref:Uncharacterized protein n=1 Tax=Soboliphyme baturini TaxID=241478 RepID=A0A183J5R5_9BILA|nr:unnamed protein product [Soboliphyme baturini]
MSTSYEPSFITGNDRCMLRARIHIIPAVERRALNVSYQGKGPMEFEEPEMQRQVGTTDRTMTTSIEEDYQNFIGKLLQWSKTTEHAQLRRLDPRVSEMT